MQNMAAEKILKANIKDINKSFIEDMFAAYHDKSTGEFKESNFKPDEKIILTHNEYKWVKDKVDTTVGMLLFNRYILEQYNFIEHIGYWNNPMNSKNLSRLNVVINNLVIIDKITTKDLGNYVDARDRLGFWCSAFLSTSISAGLIRPMQNVNERKAQLFKENEAALNSNDAVEQIMTVNKMEKELMGLVRENLKSDPGYDMYASGDGNLDNNYKTINVMRGAVFNNATKRYDIVNNSLMEGVKQKDITAFANSIVAGAYPGAVGTADAGYMAKIILALLQSERINPDPNSDCGTHSTIPITIGDHNKDYMLFRYIDNGGKKVLLTFDNISNYIDKTVNVYTPQACLDDAICGKCAGRVFHNLHVENVGLLLTQFTMKMLNLKLKAKHDLSQAAGIIPMNYVFLDKNNYAYIDKGVLKNKVTMKMFIPRLLEELKGFIREPAYVTCMGLFPVKFYNSRGDEVLSTTMSIPAILSFNVYNDIQEEPDKYIITYEPESDICNMGIQKSNMNVEYYINQIYLYSKTAQIPYNLMTEMMFRCLHINGIDLTAPAVTYEMLARRLCRSGNDTFAKVFGRNMNVDQMSYKKQWFRGAVQEAGVLQGVLFQDISESMNMGLVQTLNGVEPTDTPLEKIIKS